MCQSHRTQFRCKHFREQIAPHQGDGSFAECRDTKANVTLQQDNSHDCPRCNNKRAASSSSRAYANNINIITAGLSGMRVSASASVSSSASAPPALAPGRPSALYAEKVRLVVAAKLARKRAMQATATTTTTTAAAAATATAAAVTAAASAAAAAATAAAATGRPPAQASAPPAQRAPPAGAITRDGAPAGAHSSLRGVSGRVVGGGPTPAAAAAAAVNRAPAVRGGQVPAKVQGRVVVPGPSRG